jgi:hypothetical protein
MSPTGIQRSWVGTLIFKEVEAFFFVMTSSAMAGQSSSAVNVQPDLAAGYHDVS